VALEAQELGGEFAVRSLQHLLHRDRGVVVGDLVGTPPEELERVVVRRLEGLGALAWEGQDEEGVAVGKAHHRQRDLSAHVGDLDDRFAEVELGLARWLGERHEDLAVTVVVLGEVTPDVALGSLVAVLVTQTLKDPLGGVALLLGSRLIEAQNLIDHPEEGPELGAGPLTLALLIALWLDVLEHLGERLVTEAVVAADLTPRHLFDQYFSANLRPNLHVAVHPSPVPPVGSLRNQLASRGCWVWLFSMRILRAKCGCLRCAFTIGGASTRGCATSKARGISYVHREQRHHHPSRTRRRLRRLRQR